MNNYGQIRRDVDRLSKNKLLKVKSMNSKEQIEHEVIKNVLKMAVINNTSLSPIQKQQAMDRIDEAAKQADWIVKILRQCGYII